MDSKQLKKLTKNHYNKYTFIEPDIKGNERFIRNNEMFLGLLPLEDIKGNIIEVGCGTGKYLKLLEMAGKRDIIGIDISANSLKIAGKYLKYSKLEEGDATNLKNFRNNSFNTVICAGVAHHTPSPRKVFDECVRICRKDGTIIFGVYRKHSLYYYDYALFNRLVKLIFRLKMEKLFFPFFKLWFLYLSGSVPNDRTLLSAVTDRYLSPVVYFFELEGGKGIRRWVTGKKNLKLIKVSYTWRKSLINLLIKKTG